MNLLINQEINLKKWNDLLQNTDFASPFQAPAFYDLIVSVPGYSAEIFATEENEILQSLMVVVIQKEKGIKAFFSRRGIVYGGPLLRTHNTESFNFLVQGVEKSLRNRLIYIETRNFFDYSNFDNYFHAQDWRFVPYLNFQINSNHQSVDDTLAKMKYNRRREIKQSLLHGATYSISDLESDALAVYNILHGLYKTRVRLPLPDFGFFRSFLTSDIARLFVVKYDGRVIAGCFSLFLPGKNLFTMYYCGEREINRKIFPTSLAIYAAIEFAIKSQIPIVDLMGAGKPGQEYGVRDYKSQFGGDLVEHGRYLKVLNPFLYNVGKAGLKIKSKIKL